jgi:WS/DGAT/MGAT family acyltransferase
MARYAYDRLSPASASLLEAESSRSFGHSGATMIFEPGPLGRPDGGVDFDAIRTAIDSVLHRAPEYRRKLRWIPFENHPIWVDDPEFNLDYHVRHTSLARPGTSAQLRKVAARLQAQRLDRSRPLWECWVVEGLEGGRFALLTKTHNALGDVGEEDLLGALLSPDPDATREPAPPFRPQPLPSALELVRDELLRGARLPRRAVSGMSSLAHSEDLSHELQSRLNRLVRLAGYSLRRGPDTPLNGQVGPHRRFDHLVLPFGEARRIRKALGGSVHDVILTILSGAVSRYLRIHYVNPATLDFRVSVPVSLANEDESGDAVGESVLELPIWENDPLRCFEGVRERTERQHRESPALRAPMVSSDSRWTSSRRLVQGVRAIASNAPVSLRVVNVPGPQVPLYLEGARLAECYGKVPLGEHGGLGVAVQSYDGKLCWGLNADFDLVPDLPRFTEALRESFEALSQAAARSASPLSVVGAS